MSGFIKRFWPLLIGLSLPILLIVFVVVIQAVSRWNAPPITTPVLYWPDSNYWLRPQVKWSVESGVLSISYTENQVARTNQPERSLTLWLYRPESGESTSFEIPLPQRMEDGKQVDLIVPEALQSMTLDSSLLSPEGYRFEVSSRGSRGLFVELFGGYRHHRAYQLVGHGVRHPLPEGGRYLADGAFVAWAVGEGTEEDSE